MDDSLLEGMRRAVIEDLAAEAEAPEAPEVSLGSLAVAAGRVTAGQLAECLAEQKEAAEKGRAPTLGQIMLRRRLLTASDLIGILIRQHGKEGRKAETIGRYLLLGELGRGAGGVVYRALNQDLDREIALKVMVEHSELPQGILERFQREARIAAALRHPNIVRVHDVGADGPRHYIAMDLVDGPTLARWMADPDRSLRAKLGVLSKVARALAEAHRHGIVHRDLKPANILLGERDEPCVTDFGLARSLEGPAGATQSGSVMGTPAYMAPEQVRGDLKDIDARTDVYALGVILYEMLTGSLPFQGQTAAEVYDRILRCDSAPPSRLRRGVPGPVEIVCLKAMERDPRRRFANADLFADDLDRFLRGEPIATRPPSAGDRIVRTFRRRAREVTAVALGAALAVTLALLLLGAPKSPEVQPADASAYRDRAWLRRQKGDLRGALEDCTAAIRLRPDFGPAWYDRALVHEALGDGKSMLADLDEAIDRMKSDPHWDRTFLAACLARGNQRLRDGQFQPACEDFSRVLEWKPDDVEALSGRGICFRRLELFDECVRDLELVFQLKPEAPQQLREVLADAKKRQMVEASYVFDSGSLDARTRDLELEARDAATNTYPNDTSLVLSNTDGSAVIARFQAPAVPHDMILELEHCSAHRPDYEYGGTTGISIFVNGRPAIEKWEIGQHAYRVERLYVSKLARLGENTIEIRLVSGTTQYWLRRLKILCSYKPGTSLPRSGGK